MSRTPATRAEQAPVVHAARRPRPLRPSARLTSSWCAWIAENVVRGAPDQEILASLTEHGVSRRLAQRALASIKESPALHGLAVALRGQVAGELRARLRRELQAGRRTPTIERRPLPAASEFYDRYWAGNRPAVFTDATRGWTPWTPRDLQRMAGDTEVRITDGRESDPRYDERFTAHARPVRLGDFVERVLSSAPSNDFYLVAQGKAMEQAGLAPLLEGVVLDDSIFDRTRLAGATSLWLGPAGTVTPLHHDGTNVFFAQLHGRKQFILAAPEETAILQSARGFYSAVDPERPDLERFPWWSEVATELVVLAPGEVLFIPVGWWHHVRALDVSLSLSFMNFRQPNRFEWYRPGFAPTL